MISTLKYKNIVLLLISVLFIKLFTLYNRNAYSIAKIHLGFDLPRTVVVEKKIDKWPMNFTGDGETFLEFSFSNSDKDFLLKNVITRNYKPVNDYKSFLFNDCRIGGYVIPCFALGFDKIEEGFAGNNTKEILLDVTNNKLYIYYLET